MFLNVSCFKNIQKNLLQTSVAVEFVIGNFVVARTGRFVKVGREVQFMPWKFRSYPWFIDSPTIVDWYWWYSSWLQLKEIGAKQWTPLKYKGLMRPYYGKAMDAMVNKPLIRPYLLGGEGWLAMIKPICNMRESPDREQLNPGVIWIYGTIKSGNTKQTSNPQEKNSLLYTV